MDLIEWIDKNTTKCKVETDTAIVDRTLFKCPVCKKQMSELLSLHDHIVTVHCNTAYFECRVCKKKFRG
jgi:hypothetical protein